MEDKTVITGAPPPPSEIKIRTMRSDLASMRSSGGGMPKFQNVNVSGLSIEKGYHSPVQAQAPFAERQQPTVPAVAEIATKSASTPTEAPTSAPASAAQSPDASAQQDVSGDQPESHLVPILIVVLVAIVAIAVVGYFAYITFAK